MHVVSSSPHHLEAIDALAGVARGPEVIERALTAARELLGMELAYLAEAGESDFRFAGHEGDGEAFGVRRDGRLARAGTPCDAMLEGRIGNVVGDLRDCPEVDHDGVAGGIGAYVGVPVELPDGSVYGSLCCISAQPNPALLERDARMLDVLARIIGDQLEREREQRRAARLEGEAAAGHALLAALQARERYTAAHSEAVVDLATTVAEELGLPATDVIEVAQVALLHDVGKIGIPDAILQKPGPLDSGEWQVMRTHPALGERVVASVPALAHLAGAVRAEHERWDGTGYPDGLAGEAIPLASRICLACDAWHAMVSDRPYRTALAEDDARAELARHAGSQFCPRTVDALLSVLDGRPAPAPRAPAVPPPPARPEAELRALIAVAGAVAAAHRLEDVLEVVAEETYRVVSASSVSISRWELDTGRVRTLINVGRLGPSEERTPADEVYDLPDFPGLGDLLAQGTPYVVSSADLDLSPADRRLLTTLGKRSYAAVPVRFDGRTWGMLDVFSGDDDPPFTWTHVPFLQAIAGQVGAAIGRAELFSRVNALAYSDPLTGLANRRALDDRLQALTEHGGRVTIAFCDLDGLKQINDAGGHEAGDRAIRRAAGALEQAAAGGFVARIGGDEFCVLLPDGDARRARAVCEAAGRALEQGPASLRLSCGVAERRHGESAAELFRAADAAQYAAKRDGRGRTVVAGQATASCDAGSARRALRTRTQADARELAAGLLAAIEHAPAEQRLDRLASALAALD